MGIDCYEVEILHYLNPYLIFAEVTHEAASSPSYEQIGIYGVLPLETTIDGAEEAVRRRRSSEWMPAANLLMTEVLTNAKQIVFMSAYIDRRTSSTIRTFFDNNIHKYGELIIKKFNGEVLKLSQELVEANLAIYNEVQFHTELGSGKLKTELTKSEYKNVVEAMTKYNGKKGFKNGSSPASKQQQQLNQCMEYLGTVLTEENLQLHNGLTNSPKRLTKDSDESPLGELSHRRTDSNSFSQITSSDTKSLLQIKLDTLRKNLTNMPVVNKNEFTVSQSIHDQSGNISNLSSPKGLIVSTESTSKLESVKRLMEIKMRSTMYKEQNSMNASPNVVRNENAIVSTETVDVSEKVKDNIDHTPTRNVQKTPVFAEAVSPATPKTRTPKSHAPKSKSNKPPPYDPATQMRVAFGPPECDRSLLQLQVVPRHQFEESLPEQREQEDVIPPPPEKDDFDDTDSKVNMNVTSRVDVDKFPEIDVEDIDLDIKASPLKHDQTPASCSSENNSFLQQKLRIMKEASRHSVDLSQSSGTSTKDASSSFNEERPAPKKTDHVESDEETICMSEIVKKLESEYAEEIMVSPQVDHKETKPSLIVNQKNYVNPFKNVDPNISVFVDKLVTPVVMVHSAMNMRFQPSFLMRDVCFNNDIQVTLKNLGIERPMNIQTLTWASILRGHSILIVSPKGSGKTIGYLPAVARLLAVSDANVVDSVGPSCIIVCATAISVSDVERLAKRFCEPKKTVLTLYTGMTDIELTTSILNGCDLLICTPSILFRLLKSSDFGIDLRRLITFVLDDCERLAKVYGAEIVYFQKKIRDMLRNRVPKEMKVQYIVASREWCDFMRPLAKAAPDAVVCIGAFQECVLYSQANTSASFVTKENKDKTMLDFLNQIDRSKKTVIVCRKDEEVQHLEKVLTNAKYAVIACNSTMDVQELYNLSLTLGNYENSVSGLILVCCDGNVTHLNVTDAHNLVHYSLPILFSMFCKRFSVLNENYPSMFKKDNEDVKIKILLDDSNIEQIPKILHFIKRCTTAVTDILDEICQKVLDEKDLAKAKDLVPVCDNLLALGECPDYWNCRERHAVFKEFDEPLDWMPTSGEITFQILHYHNAVFYSVRLITNIVNGKETKYSQGYNMLSTKISMYFATESNQKLHGPPKVGDICAVSVKQNFYARCQVVKILSHYQRGNPNEVLIRLIDEERLQKSRDIYLYHLPEDIKSAQTHTIQVRLAGVQPKEKDITFSKLASDRLKAITNSDKELYLRGHIALTIGNCVFVDSLMTYKDLTFSGNVLRHDLKQELLDSFAKTNPDQIQKLQNLCESAQLIKTKTSGQVVNVDVVKPIKELPETTWAHLEQDGMSPTIFTYAIDPDTFFVRLVKFDQLMDGLIDDIQKIVQNSDPISHVKKGDIVLAKLPDDGMYERARIDEVIGENKVKCFYVDHGDWRELAVSDLAPIPDKFITRLPFQAIECRLFGVRPSGENWTDFSNIWLTNCFEDHDGNPKRFYVKRFTKVPAQYTGGHKYGVAVIDTTSEKDVVINQSIVEVNMAREIETEMKMINEMDLTKETLVESSENESDDQDEDWEKVPRQQDHETIEKPTVPLENLFLKKPIRSVPLVGSDDESEDEDKWACNMTEDFMSLFRPAAQQPGGNLLSILGKDNDSDASISVISSPHLQDVAQDCKPVKYASSQSSSENSVSIINSVHSKSEGNDVKSLQSVSLNSEHASIAEDMTTLDSDDLTSPEPTEVHSIEKLPVTTKLVRNNEKPAIISDTQPKVIDKIKNNKHRVAKFEIKPHVDELRKPKLVWRQNKNKVHVKISIIVQNYEIDIQEQRLKFAAVANDTNYGFDFQLYGVIDVEQCKHDNKGQYILVTLTKILNKNWLGLTKDPSIKKWIVYDVDSLDVSDEETTDQVADIPPKMESDSDSEEEEFVDDVSYRYSRH